MSESEIVLLQRVARSGDAEAFSEIVSRYAAMVYGAAIRVLADADRAADATQDTFFDLLQHASEITGSVGGWLHRVATRKAIDRIRRDSARRSREAQYAAGQAVEVRKWQDISPYVDEALDHLDEETRQILIDHFFFAKTMSTIAAARDVSQPTVSRRVEVGIEKLRDKLRTRGILVAGAALSGLLADNAVQAAPAAVLTELGKMAMVGGASTVAAAGAAGAGTAKVAALSAMAGAKVKIIAAAAVVIAGTGGVITYKQVTHKGGAYPPAASVSQTDPGRSAPSERNTGAGGAVDTAAMSDEEFEKWLFSQGMEEETAAEPQPAAAEPSAPAVTVDGTPVAADTPAFFTGGFGGMGMGGMFVPDFSAPDRTVSSFMQVVGGGDMSAIAGCFVEGAEDLNDLRRILTDPQDADEVQMKQVFESLGPPVEIVETAEEAAGLGVKWLSTVTREFSVGGTVFREGDKFELDAKLVDIDGQWKIAGM